MQIVTGALFLASWGGLALVALGLLPFGPRGVAALTLLGFAWTFALVVLMGIELNSRIR